MLLSGFPAAPDGCGAGIRRWSISRWKPNGDTGSRYLNRHCRQPAAAGGHAGRTQGRQSAGGGVSLGLPRNTGVALLALEAEDYAEDPSVEHDGTARRLALTSLPFIG